MRDPVRDCLGRHGVDVLMVAANRTAAVIGYALVIGLAVYVGGVAAKCWR